MITLLVVSYLVVGLVIMQLVGWRFYSGPYSVHENLLVLLWLLWPVILVALLLAGTLAFMSFLVEEVMYIGRRT